ncbi:type II CAAX endopeptidase family protein [Streptococcus merionis]|uniref:type II CAAX endopeptidase family protein n=1 Tax=Streptococcus merionis TaxID=400065 RepID=UPI0026EBC854|nr:type II CAAX endopeptidase family protein [Streptococcus merionis]
MFWEKLKFVLHAIALFIVYQLPSFFLGIALAVASQGRMAIGPVIFVVIGLLLVFVIAGCIVYASRMGFWEPKAHYFKPQNLAIIGLGYLVILGLNIAISYLFNVQTTSNQEVVEALVKAVPLPLYFLLLVIAAPICEEIIFRGIVFKKLSPNNILVAYLVSIVTFALVHMPTDLGSWLVYLSMGGVLSISYYLSKSLEVSIAVHMLNNFIAFLSIIFLL